MKFIFLFLLSFSWSGSAESVDTWNVNKGGYVIHGFDPVAYHNDNMAVRGGLYAATYKGAKFLFSSAENRDLFLKNPARYVPAYGGYCSYGVRVGKKFDINPQTWKIVDDILYLQLDAGTKVLWEKDLKKNISIADRLWPKLEPVPASDLSE